MDDVSRRTAMLGLAAVAAGSLLSCNTTQKGGPTVADPKLQLDAIFQAHMDAELAGNLDKTLATMAPNPHLVNVPTMAGGQGPKGVRIFYANRLIGPFCPPDVKFEVISRTYSQERLVDELIISFTHTTKIDWLLPGIDPTGLPVTGAGAAAKLRNPSLPDPFFKEG